MIINIFGPSGSGKTTLIHNLLLSSSTKEFFIRYSDENTQEDLNKRISISLIPIPSFRGTVGEFFDIFRVRQFSESAKIRDQKSTPSQMLSFESNLIDVLSLLDNLDANFKHSINPKPSSYWGILKD